MSKNEIPWKEQFDLTVDEAKTCRFECMDQSMRMFSCKTHNGKHGLRLQPVHKFEVKDEIIYKKVGDTLTVWYDYLYDKENRGTSSGGSNASR